jgi:hypothetical protein
MGFDIDSLVGKSVETTVHFAGEEAVVHYDPNVLTKTRVAAAEKGDEDFLTFFVALVQDWDVTQGGTKVALKVEALEPLPIAFLRAVFVHILRESSSGDLGKVSSVSSRRKAPRDRAPRSTATSKRRATSA